MAYVVTALCLDCKYTDCAEVCPTQAFHEGADRLYINPKTCIDCDACVPKCPVDAIFAEENVPAKYRADIALNRDECDKHNVIELKMRALKGSRCVDPNKGD